MTAGKRVATWDASTAAGMAASRAEASVGKKAVRSDDARAEQTDGL